MAGARAATSDWVLVTDADARMAPGSLRALVSQALAAPDVRVVGTPVQPRGAHPLDEWHWRVSNGLRAFEFRRGSAGLVVGPCYLVRRDLLLEVPDDVLADDLYVTCRAAVSGGRAAVVSSLVVELRSPQSNRAWFRHKRRRGVGYLREVLRFLPQVPGMRGPARHAFLLRFGLLTALPASLMAAVGAAATLASAHPAAAGVAAGLTGLTAAVYHASTGRVRRQLAALALLPALAVVITATWITYPFSRATACYPKASLAVEDPESC
jgi:hypothetical protein